MMTTVKEERIRTQAKKNFTTSVNLYNLLHASASSIDLLTNAFEKVQRCWDLLESAQNAFIEVTEIEDIELDPKGLSYLDVPEQNYQDVLKTYSAYKKQAATEEQTFLTNLEKKKIKDEDERRAKEAGEERSAVESKKNAEREAEFSSAKVDFEIAVDNFIRVNKDIQEILTDASDIDKRREWEKLEDEIDSLRKKLVALGKIDPTQDISDIKKMFLDDAETPFTENHKWFVNQLKSTSTTPSTTASATDTSSAPKVTSSLTKRENVKLPWFYGDQKKLPFLAYPTWKAEWDALVVDYEVKVRPTILKDHLDEVAKSKFIGYERDYDEMMKRLDAFYGDPLKVVECVMKEVSSPSAVKEGDYKGLISFTDTLENNFNRLKCMSLEHEMSNTTTMSSVLVKFPRSVAEKWSEHLITMDKGAKARPFPALIDWLITQKQIWENVDALNIPKSGRLTTSFFGDGNQGPGVKNCYQCGQDGHLQRNCPNRKPNGGGGGGGGGSGGNDKKTPKKPTVKKFWCAFHRDDATKRCSSINCQDLRRCDATKRIKLLKDNGDCIHCVGDHKPDDCSRKGRICGGGKDDRGCTQTHCLNELFCQNAKCFSVTVIQEVHSVGTDDADSEGVVLLIMNVRVTKNGIFASVFWDLGCSSNFVREAFAKQMGFTGKEEHLCVTTLGNVTTDYHVITYTCYLLDVNGEVHEFKAYGMESITGALTRISEGTIKKLFPRLPHNFVSKLLRKSKVDFLIGMKHPSWHPDKVERSQEGGDIWLHRGDFGTCVGGRHSDINEGTRRSDNLFSVNFVYHADIVSDTYGPHTLDFCPERVTEYVHKSGYCENAYFGKSICNPPLIEHSTDEPSGSSVQSTTNNCESLQLEIVELEDEVVAEEPVSDSPSIPSMISSHELLELEVVELEDEAESDSLCEFVAPEESLPSALDSALSSDEGTVNLTIPVNSELVPSPMVTSVHANTIPSIIVHDSEHVSLPTSDDSSNVVQVESVQQTSCHSTKTAVSKSEELFFQTEALGTAVNPQCGACKCGKCPIPGSKYSYSEQKGWETVQKNLRYDAYKRRYYTVYPWLVPRSTLPKNDRIAYQSLVTLERMLSRNMELAEEFCAQIEDMVKRGAAVILTDEQLASWKGDYHFLPLVAVRGKEWLRVCCDASRRQGGYPSINDCVHKGPDRFINNILSVWIGFRNGRVGCAADISKFHNQVYLEEPDMHMQRFL